MPIIRRPHVTTIDTGEMVWGPLAGPVTGLGSLGTHALNDNNNSVATIFQNRKSGSLVSVGVNVTGITGTPPSYRVRFETLDSGLHSSGTAYGGCEPGTFQPAEPGFYWVEVATPATSVVGEFAAARIYPVDPYPDASNYITVVNSIPIRGDIRVPRSEYLVASWGAVNALALGAKYSDGSVAVPGIISVRTLTFDALTDPDERGNLFTLPFTVRCIGVVFYVAPYLPQSDFKINLYDASGNVIATSTVDSSATISTTGGYHKWYWPQIDLPAGTYRLTLQALGAHSLYDVYVSNTVFADVASREWFAEGSNWQATYRTDEGAWTDDPLGLFCSVSLLLSQIEVVS
jgi:hypothetical protein